MVKRIILLLVLVLLCAALLFYYWKGGMIAMSATDMLTAANAFMDDAAAGRIDSAYARTSNRFRAGHSLAQFRSMIDQQPLLKEASKRTLRNYEITTRHHIEGHAIFRCTVQASQATLPVELALTTEEAEWRIDGLTFGAH